MSERRPPIEVREIESLRAELERQAASPQRWNADAEDVQLGRPASCHAVEFLRRRQRQAIRRMEARHAHREETEDIRLARCALEETVRAAGRSLRSVADDLNLDLGPRPTL